MRAGILKRRTISAHQGGNVPPSTEIWYTTIDGNTVRPLYMNIEESEEPIYIEIGEGYEAFGANLVSNTYTGGKGVMKFDRPITKSSIWMGLNVFSEEEVLEQNTIKTLAFPDSVTQVGLDASELMEEPMFMYFCICLENLEEIRFPNSNFNPGAPSQYMLFGCTSLKTVVLPNIMTNLGSYFFTESKLSDITLPETLTSIGDYAFYCTVPGEDLETLTVPASVTSIGDGAFNFFEAEEEIMTLKTLKLESITPPTLVGSLTLDDSLIPEDFKIVVPVESVGAYKLAEGWSNYEDKITSPYVPTTYKSLSVSADNVSARQATAKLKCTYLTDGYNPDTQEPLYNIEITETHNSGNFGVNLSLTESKQHTLTYSSHGLTSSTQITQSNFLTVFNNEILYKTTSGSTVDVSYPAGYDNEVISNTSYTNGYCTIICENNVEEIRENAFLRCTSLASINLPSSIVSIGNYAFSDCTSLASINYEGTISEYNNIEKGYNWYKGGIVHCSDGDIEVFGTNYKSTYTGGIVKYEDSISDKPNLISCQINSSLTSIIHSTFNGCSLLSSVVIPNSIEVIELCAFAGCSSLIEINIPNSVISIGDSTFSDCLSLVSINIPNSVTSIGESAFYGCSSLTEIVIPNSVTSIKRSTFTFCTSLVSINIPNSVTSIGGGAFFGCSSLSRIVIPSSVTSIKYNTFIYCSSLTEINIPNSVTSIGTSAFDGCSSLTEIVIPNSVTSIEESAFRYCSSLTEITIPNSVTSIGTFAFWYCTLLSSVTVEAITPPILGNEVFYNNKSGRKIYVPAGSVDAYKSAIGWIKYASDIEPII